MVGRLKHEGTFHGSSDLLKFCVKMWPAGQHRISDRLVVLGNVNQKLNTHVFTMYLYL